MQRYGARAPLRGRAILRVCTVTSKVLENYHSQKFNRFHTYVKITYIKMTHSKFNIFRKFGELSSYAGVVGSQMLSSLGNFLYILILLRSFGPSEFGVYSIYFAITLVVSALVQGFFITQMVVLTPRLKKSAGIEFGSGVLALQVAVLICMCLTIMVVIKVVNTSETFQSAFLSISLASISLSLKEYVLKYLFAIGEPAKKALLVNSSFILALGAALVSQFATATPEAAVIGFGLANSLAFAVSLTIAPICFRMREISASLSKIRRPGSWSAFSALIQSLRATAHTFIVGIELSAPRVGEMNAARTLVTPATLLLPAFAARTIPHLSQTYHSKGWPAAISLWRQILAIPLTASATLGVITWALWPLISDYVPQFSMKSIHTYLALWVIFSCTLAVRHSFEWLFHATGLQRNLALIAFPTGVASIGCTWLGARNFGVEGAILGVILGELISVFLLWLKARKIDL